MPSRPFLCLSSALVVFGICQSGGAAAQRVPSVPGPPTVPSVPRPAAGPNALQSGVSRFQQSPSAAPGQGRRFDAGGVGAVPGADSATQSTNATDATNASGGTGYSGRRR